MSHYNDKIYILVGFYVEDQRKVVCNCDIKGKSHMVFTVVSKRNLKSVVGINIQTIHMFNMMQLKLPMFLSVTTAKRHC